MQHADLAAGCMMVLSLFSGAGVSLQSSGKRAPRWNGKGKRVMGSQGEVRGWGWCSGVSWDPRPGKGGRHPGGLVWGEPQTSAPKRQPGWPGDTEPQGRDACIGGLHWAERPALKLLRSSGFRRSPGELASTDGSCRCSGQGLAAHELLGKFLPGGRSEPHTCSPFFPGPSASII